MADKTYLSKEINFNKAPVMWAGMEVYPGNGATSNLYGTLNVIKNPEETIVPDINTDGNVNVKKDVNVDGNVTTDGNVNVKKNVNVDGNVTAEGDVKSNGGGHILSAKKNFDIPHPTKDGWRLTHTCVEGPEASVYIRGRVTDRTEIELPLYWKDLVDIQSITVNLTSVGVHQNVIVKRWDENKIYLQAKDGIPIDCFYYIMAERKDTEKLIPEYQGTIEDYPGDNSQRSIAGYHYDIKENN
jgi:hypothetical protein